MDPFERQFRGRGGVKTDAIIAFAIATLAAYIIQFTIGLGGGQIFTTLIVAAVGGLWYKVRNVV